MAYITTTHLLERIHPKTLVVNDPAHVRNAPEKVFVLDFLDLMPPTLVTRNAADVKLFRAEHKDIIIKPLYGNGGSSVFRVKPDDTNLNSLIELFQTVFREPFMVQQYRPEVRGGDKRIILIDGELAGAINHVPAADETRSNLHVGGTAPPVELTDRDREICARLGPELKKRGLLFTGIDVIGPYLTEINVTSPTGIRQLKKFGGADVASPDLEDAQSDEGGALGGKLLERLADLVDAGDRRDRDRTERRRARRVAAVRLRAPRGRRSGTACHRDRRCGDSRRHRGRA